jgi:flavin reductase (DIM6/NTAB) family NADH-FMN oxidoreductase RutF
MMSAAFQSEQRASMTISSEELRYVMRSWSTGVSLVSSHHDGLRHGMTVSAFTSVSLEPPLVLISLERITRTRRLVDASGHFAVSILAADQRELSDRFAGRIPDDGDRFEGIATRDTPSGCPVPHDSLAFLDCQVTTTYEGGTHTIFLGEVLAAEVLRQAPPLLYFNQDYRSLLDPEGEPPRR